MPKSSQEQIEKDEQTIVKELQKNAKQSIDKIAEKCGFSRQKVWRVIKKMEEDKTILGYPALINYDKFGLKHYTALFKRNSKPFGEDIVEDIMKGHLGDRLPEGDIKIDNALFVHGEYDWIISFTAPNIMMMKKFIDKLMAIFGEFIESYSVQETIITVRRQGIKNPMAKELADYF